MALYSSNLSCAFLRRFIINHPKVKFQNEGKGRRLSVLSWIVKSDLQKTKYYFLHLSDHVFIAPADPRSEGTVTEEVSGAAASRLDSRDSTGVRSAQKRKSPERGTSNS